MIKRTTEEVLQACIDRINKYDFVELEAFLKNEPPHESMGFISLAKYVRSKLLSGYNGKYIEQPGTDKFSSPIIIRNPNYIEQEPKNEQQLLRDDKPLDFAKKVNWHNQKLTVVVSVVISILTTLSTQ